MNNAAGGPPFTPLPASGDGLQKRIGTREETMVHRRIREILGEHGRLSVAVDQIRDDASLYQAGLTSHASVNLMLAIEENFGIEFPEHMLRRRTFESIASIVGAIGELAEPGTRA